MIDGVDLVDHGLVLVHDLALAHGLDRNRDCGHWVVVVRQIDRHQERKGSVQSRMDRVIRREP